LERSKRKELERLAHRIVLESFPVLKNNEALIALKGELVDELSHSNLSKESEFQDQLMDEYRKRKLANMFIQGAGVNTHGIHHIDDEFRSNNEELVRLYDMLDNINMRSIRTIPDELIESMSEIQLRSFNPNGMMKLEYNSGVWTINAKATIMPVLIHEMIKGVYELLAMYGLPKDYEVSERVMAYTDTTRNEFIDLKYGASIYAHVRDFIRNNFHIYTDKRPEILEYYFQELYEMSPQEMVGAVNDIITGKMDPKRIKSTIEGIYNDLERDERGKRE
jgi:hypothetical protein